MVLYQWGTLALTGLAAGVLGGMLGIGGSVIMIPAMLLICRQGQHLAQGAAMMVNVCVALPAAYRHFRAGALSPDVLKTMIPAAVVSVILGVRVSDWTAFHGTGEVLLTGMFGVFLLYVFYRNLLIVMRPRREQQLENADLSTSRNRLGGLAVGTLAGFVGGLLGIGGGIIAVPAQQVLMHTPIRKAVANSAAAMVFLSSIGAAYKNYHLVAHFGVPFSDPLRMALILVPGAIVGSYIGAGLTHSVATRYVRGILMVLILTAAFGMIWQCAGPSIGRP